MRISVSSNVISAVYIIIFDLLFPVLLAALNRVFLSSWNLKLIYQNRKPVYLTSTKISVVVSQGLTERRVGRVVAVVSATIVGLLVAGGFSIAGESRKSIESVTASVVIDSAAPEELIDFTKHISPDGNFVSGTYLLASGTLDCSTINNGTFTYVSAINDIPDLNSIKWPANTQLHNSTCRTERNNYVEKVLSREFVSDDVVDLENCTVTVEPNPTIQVGRPAKAEAVNCPFVLLETWCAISNRAVCVGLVKFPTGYTTFDAWYKFNSSSNSFQHVERKFLVYHFDSKLESISLRSMAYILATQFGSFRLDRSSQGAKTMARSTIRTKVLVEQYSGVVNETEVNLNLLCLTLGSALFLTLVLSVVTLKTWKATVYDHGRQNYNSFHTAADMLSCAICEVRKDGRCRFKRTEPINVGLAQVGPRLRPVLRVKALDASLINDNNKMLGTVDAEEHE